MFKMDKSLASSSSTPAKINKLELKPLPATELNQYVIKLLANHKITTVLQFLKTDTNSLVKFTNVNFDEIEKIKSRLIRINGPPVINCLNYYKQNKCFPVFSTGISSLDNILDGGFYEQNIIEICGLPGIGKSVLVSTLAVNLIHQYNYDVIYLDTKSDFSASRVNKMLEERKFNKEIVKKIMDKIKVERIFTPEEFENTLTLLFKHVEVHKKIKFVIIDSIAAVALQFYGDKLYIKNHWLFKVATLMRQLANELKIIIIIVNLMTEIEDADEIDSMKSQTTNKPSLGKRWEIFPTIRMQIKNENKSSTIPITLASSSNSSAINENYQRQIKILKNHFHNAGKSCTVTISNLGIT